MRKKKFRPAPVQQPASHPAEEDTTKTTPTGTTNLKNPAPCAKRKNKKRAPVTDAKKQELKQKKETREAQKQLARARLEAYWAQQGTPKVWTKPKSGTRFTSPAKLSGARSSSAAIEDASGTSQPSSRSGVDHNVLDLELDALMGDDELLGDGGLVGDAALLADAGFGAGF
mmetsp:Transcript_18895/g.47213  ORF Transcript_18895/g.47213 Transcript_18895/m.47213 type:complete len:171 (+) Transcript_18895:110-622(+)|eukprot:CAMPEP_0179000214 /NCGR_PEP_ID=MMETSP0795-20121207/10527_1 /TAXON_ID=88552 /ORGANISM="Amoebophrya sp., Strain Ameob2" /LENGTH=170 /DNA_ID=CAMNT_0020693145 /DNA_START=50 /DNA_END=562 /DNA_ORIENTATION=-